MMDWQGIPITDGSAQQDRLPAAFASNYFNVDEQSFENLLAMGADIAAQIKYYNLDNRADGNWAALFNADEAVIMATILSVDLGRLGSEFRAIPFNQANRLANFLLRLVTRVDFWFRRLSACGHSSGERLAHMMETLISDKLAPELHKLIQTADFMNIEPEVDLSRFAAAWGLGSGDAENSHPQSSANTQPEPAEIKRHLRATFNTFSNAIAYLQTSAATLLQQSLESEQHEPAIGLFIVFLQLLKKAQGQLNHFTERHLDFYYRRVLRADNRAPVPDSYYLLLHTRPDVGKLSIEKNTAFSAGKDADQKDIVYRADENHIVSAASLESLATLYLPHDRLVSPESDLGYVARIKAERPSIDPDQSSPHTAESTAWPLFGAGQSAGSRATALDARMGFAIASPMLLLGQGQRKIEIRFELESVSPGELDARLDSLLKCETRQSFQKQLGELFALYLLRFKGGLNARQKNDLIDKVADTLPQVQADEIKSLLLKDWQGLFYRLFKQPFRIKLTSDSGWIEVMDSILLPYSEDQNLDKTGFRLLLNLDQAQPPVTGYQADQHGGELPTDLPVLQCELNPQAHFCVYSVFQHLLIAQLQIDVEVCGIRDLQIYNQNGQLDPGKPFQPFGPLPNTCSYLIFGHHEVAHKPLQEINIHLDWAELPAGIGGFNEYYSAYPLAIGNDSFEVDFSSLVDSRWLPADTATRACFKLFESCTPGHAVSAQKTIKIDQLTSSEMIGSAIEATDFRYDLKARGGFYRLSLVNPPSAFGHAEYTRLLTRVLSANAKKKKPDPAPNLPYTPTLNGISLDYRASSKIRPALDRDGLERIFHLHPFGIETVYPGSAERYCSLLPQYEYEGNLFIGLSANDLSGPLTLLFHLAQDRVDPDHASSASFEWFYLAADGWNQLAENRILADSTHGFLATGMVTLDIPAEISLGNSIMPTDLYWLRLSVTQAADAFSGCYFIKPNVVKVSRELKEDAAVIIAKDPAQQNNWTLPDSQPGISSVVQACDGFEGREAEGEDGFRQRISERLRHKNRALLPRDYEHLVLQKFPEIAKVKCFNSLSRITAGVKPGHVLIVVVPRSRSSIDSCNRARVDARLLDQIASFLKQLCPPFVSLEVINPGYEQIQVRCTVKFADALSEGVNLKRLNQQITDYLCPWGAPGYEARFGWSIRQRDIESYILSLGYIECVTNFSMLHITVDQQGNSRLFDTVSSEKNREAVIRPYYPWSLAIPMQNHFIETMREARSIRAEVTGIDELEIGATFIIGNSEHGEEE